MKKIFITSAFILAVFTTSCVKTTTTQIPGSINATDSFLYSSLITAQAALSSASTSISSLTPTQQAKIKPILNQILTEYNAAENSYKIYHSGTLHDPAALTLEVPQLLADITSLVAQIKAVN